VEQNNADALQKMSQQNIADCFHKVRFGLHTEQRVHGATPIEMLHALLLGIFVVIHDTFFEQCGPDSKLALGGISLGRGSQGTSSLPTGSEEFLGIPKVPPSS